MKLSVSLPDGLYAAAVTLSGKRGSKLIQAALTQLVQDLLTQTAEDSPSFS